MVDISAGISKAVHRADSMFFITLGSHLYNTRLIVQSFSDKFVSKKNLVNRAASLHDVLKARTLNPDALTGGLGLFPNHPKLSDNLVDRDFNEFELDTEVRLRNWHNYYVLSLVRLHHSGLNYDRLFELGEFLYARQNSKLDSYDFVRDWYALMTSDWLDSKIIELVFQAREIPSLVDMGVHSEIELQVEDERCFRVVQEGVLTSKVKLSYDYVEASRDNVLSILEREGRRKKLMALMSYLSDLVMQSTEVDLIEP